MHETPRPIAAYLRLIIDHPELIEEVEAQLELIQPQPRPRRAPARRRSRAA